MPVLHRPAPCSADDLQDFFHGVDGGSGAPEPEPEVAKGFGGHDVLIQAVKE